jgi:prolyl-tRNA editing enzyme YbaK/EbsC (Cys-tRNA(Pro) deacylase)
MVLWARTSLLREVRSCVEAAQARGIPLAMELKTLLLASDDLLVAAHLRGCDRLHNRRLKRICGVKNLAFASSHLLSSVGLGKGQINPWSVPDRAFHVVDTAVIEQSYMWTNDGTLTGTRHVLVASLLDLRTVRIANIRVEG